MINKAMLKIIYEEKPSTRRAFFILKKIILLL